MIANIFVSFDPYVSRTYRVRSFLFYAPVLIVVLNLGLSFFVYPSVAQIFMAKLAGVLVPNWIETTRVKLKGFIHILMSVLVLVLFLNFIRLFPYVLRYTAHLRLSATLAVPLWLSLLSSG